MAPPQSGTVIVAHSVSGDTADVEATLVIDGLAGSWDIDDPSDPPRVLGNFESGATGAFEAVYCASLSLCSDPH
jgi:hypothetical protein